MFCKILTPNSVLSKKVLILPILLILFAGCSQSDAPTASTFHGNVMTIDYHIIVGATPEQHAGIQRIIAASFDEIDSVYNKWNPQSELSSINCHAGGTPIPLSQKLEKLLVLTDQVVKLTAGRFDPTIEPVQQLWKKTFSCRHNTFTRRPQAFHNHYWLE